MAHNTFTENTKTNAEELRKIRISNVNNSSAEITCSGGSKNFNGKRSEDTASSQVSEPTVAISEPLE
jgi:hypothetical protein